MSGTPRRPAITQIGQVHDDGQQHGISGWGITWCFDRCPCHRYPGAGQLGILEDAARGRLGLISYADNDCDCCQPWTYTELAAMVRTLQSITDAPDTTFTKEK